MTSGMFSLMPTLNFWPVGDFLAHTVPFEYQALSMMPFIFFRALISSLLRMGEACLNKAFHIRYTDSSFCSKHHRMGRKMICNQKKSKVLKILKILVKIWGVGLRKFSKSEKNFFAQNIIEWAEKWFATQKVENFENFGCFTEKKLICSKHHRMGRKMICNQKSQKFWLKFGVLDLKFSKSEKNFYAQNIIEWEKSDLQPKNRNRKASLPHTVQRQKQARLSCTSGYFIQIFQVVQKISWFTSSSY